MIAVAHGLNSVPNSCLLFSYQAFYLSSDWYTPIPYKITPHSPTDHPITLPPSRRFCWMQLTLHLAFPTPRGASRFGARDICLVGENPTCSVPAL